ncbi:MAG: hypothetical protein CMJ40_03685 [Phycisphaerae bacterium]|nr:hypothetical protein [Phycisphaerae bacterium]|tara:strand:- start:743 stop:1657 length:915 start_codon:yes stop_codon:yes gene_type:complete
MNIVSLVTALIINLSQISLLGCQVNPFSSPAQEKDGHPHVSMDVRACTPNACMGQYVMIACTFTIPKGWHVYWSNPGGSGAATTIEVQGLEGLIIDPVRYPRPLVFGEGADVTYGYENELTLLVPIKVPQRFPDGIDSLDLTVRGDWFVCREKCFIGSATKSISIPLTDKREQLEPWVNPQLSRYSWPKPLSGRPRTTATYEENGTLVITGPPTRAGKIGFLPDPTPGVELGKPVVEVGEDAFFVTIPVQYSPSDSLGQEPVARGLLTFGDEATMTSYQISVPLKTTEGSDDSSREEDIEETRP